MRKLGTVRLETVFFALKPKTAATLFLLWGMLATLPTLGWAGREGQPQMINWTTLGLTPEQDSEIDRLEFEWKKTYNTICPQILRDKTELKRLLNSPQSDERQIMALQARIYDSEQILRNEATRIFLGKKGKLNATQKLRLQQMMGRQY